MAHMTAHPTLFDAAVHHARTQRWPRLVDPEKWIERTLLRSRRFVFDTAMSEFLADAEHEAMRSIDSGRTDPDWLRRTARAPFDVTWIEIDAVANTRRICEIEHKSKEPARVVPPRVGFLIEKHHALDCYRAMIFSTDTLGNEGAGMTECAAWSVCDDKLPWTPSEVDEDGGTLAEVLTRVNDYKTDKVAFVRAPLRRLDLAQRPSIDAVGGIWFQGFVPLMVALSILDDVPHVRIDVSPTSRASVSAGNRRHASHTVLHLRIPGHRTVTQEARRVIGTARRRWHEVRAHWRTYEPEQGACAAGHTWVPSTTSPNRRSCACGAWSTWVTLPNGRGSRDIGVSTPSHYSVEGGKQ